MVYKFCQNILRDELPEGSTNKYAMVGFRVGNTLSENGTVARGICSKDENENLTTCVERTEIMRIEGEVSYKDEEGIGKTIIRTANEIRFNQMGEQLLPYQLSAGEKQILAILLTVLVEDNQSYILFMDEPEISLHLEWQKQLIGLVLKLNPNIQIVMTTHSPAVVMDGWMDHVTEVDDITIK